MTGLVDSGLRYCVTHHGVLDTDQDEPCDFHRSGFTFFGNGQPCVLTPLLYERGDQ